LREYGYDVPDEDESHPETSTVLSLPEELPENVSYREGATKQIRINAYERNAEARAACIDYYGTSCVICGFDFAETYGAVGAQTIHVHHLVPLSEIREDYEVDPIRDLRPVCPNCHVIIHKSDPPHTIEDVKAFLK
jgi:5-methylcytosine-specific restriction protein A